MRNWFIGWLIAFRVLAKILLSALFVLLCGVANALNGDPNTIYSYQTGISLSLNGTSGTNWAVEYLWYDPLIADKCVIYIDSTTEISFAHNARNKRQRNVGSDPTWYIIGVDGQDGIPDAGQDMQDAGQIRYHIDEDLRVNDYTNDAVNYTRWSRHNAAGTGTRYTAYSTALTFATATYRDAVTAVLGKIGTFTGNAITTRAGNFYCGITDSLGNEWHTITVADDDEFVYDPNSDSALYPDGTWSSDHYEKLASDGKTWIFVVNPITPVLQWKAEGTSQFYTTPAKVWNIPTIHAQTTYFTTGTTLHLANITTAAVCYYRIYATGSPSGEYIAFSGPAMGTSLTALSDATSYTIEYYYDSDHKATRTIIKNPAFPSAGETHGYMLWSTDAEFDEIETRLGVGRYAVWYPYWLAYNTSWTGDRNRLYYLDTYGFQGYRHSTFDMAEKAFANAFVAMVEGTTAKNVSAGYSYFQAAKRQMMENHLSLDPLWFGDQTLHPNPSNELVYRGYYDARGPISVALAYDLFAAHWKSTDVTGGMTAIEDYFIRDLLAKWCLEAAMSPARVGYIQWVENRQGMWGSARSMGAIVAGSAIPTYDTAYYGTSGFDGVTTATYDWTPYPDYPETWWDVFVDPANTTVRSFPNLAIRSDSSVMGTYTGPMILESNQTANGYACLTGDYADKSAYLAPWAMGFPYVMAANVLKIKHATTMTYWQETMERLVDGTGIRGVQDGLYYQYPWNLVVNRYFLDDNAGDPNIAMLHFNYMTALPDENQYSEEQQMTSTGLIYPLILYGITTAGEGGEGGGEEGGGEIPDTTYYILMKADFKEEREFA